MRLCNVDLSESNTIHCLNCISYFLYTLHFVGPYTKAINLYGVAAASLAVTSSLVTMFSYPSGAVQLGDIDHTLFYNGDWPILTLILFLIFAPFMLMLFLNIITALMAAVMNTNREAAVQQYLRERAAWACWQDHNQEAISNVYRKVCFCTLKRKRLKGYLHWLTPVGSNSGAAGVNIEEKEGLQQEVVALRGHQEQQTAELQALRAEMHEIKELLLLHMAASNQGQDFIRIFVYVTFATFTVTSP